MANAIELVTNAALIGAAVLLLGYPIARLALSRTRWSWAFTLFFGLAALQVASWSWLNLTGRTLRPVGPTLLAAAGVATAMIVKRYGRRPRESTVRRSGLALVVVGVATVFLVHYQPVWSTGAYTQPSGGAADVAGYALIADHLLERGIDDPGTVSSGDLGRQARVDVFGAYAFLAFAGQVTPDATWQVNLPALLVAFVALGVSLFEMVAAFVRRVDVTLALVVVCSLAGYFTIYSLTQYFLSQFLAMIAMPAVILATFRAVEIGREGFIGSAMVVASIVAMLDMTYPQMLFSALPIAVLAGLVAASISFVHLGVWRILGAQLGAMCALVGGAAVGLALCTSRAPESIRRTLALEDAVAGWPLPKVTPLELVGFQRGFHEATPQSFVVGSVALVVAVFTAMGVLAWRGHLRAVGPAVIAVALYASYVYAYRREGISYRQWKWLSFLGPTIVGCALATVVGSVFSVRQRFGSRVRGALAVATTIGLVGLLGVQTANARTFSAWMDREVGVPADLEGLTAVGSLVDDGAVNINLSPARTGSSVWETQWAMYFTRELTVNALSPNLMALGPPCAEWTLMRRDDPDAAIAATTTRVVNDTYELLRLRTPQGVRFSGTVELPSDPSAPMQVLLSSGPDEAPNTLAVRWRLDGAAELVFLRGPGEVVVGSPFAPSPGTSRSVDVVFGEAGRVAVVLDGTPVLDAAAAFDDRFGRGVLLGTNGRVVELPDFEGHIELGPDEVAGCGTRG
jgi:hypothetical protein